MQDLQALVTQVAARRKPQQEPLRWIKANVGSHLRLIPIEDVLFFQSDTKYTLVATRDYDALIGTPIKDSLEAADGTRF